MSKITSKQIQYIKVLLRNKGLIEESENIAMKWSNERTSHISEFTVQEGIDLLKNLTNSSPISKQSQQAETMRRKIISMAREMDWTILEPSKLNGVSFIKADMVRINQWCGKYGYLHKALNSYTFAELPKLVSQFGKQHEKFLNEL